MCKRHSCASCRDTARERDRRYRAARHVDAPRKQQSGNRRDLIEDIEWLLGTDTPRNVALRLGYLRPESLTRRLYRMGRDDLAHLFQREAAT